jgi:signal transduction histidine kinase
MSSRTHTELYRDRATVNRNAGRRRPDHARAILQYPGLAPALRSSCEEVGALSGLRIALVTEGSFESVARAAAHCAMLATHGGAAEARVELRRAEGVLRLTITDAGVGTETGRAGAKAGLGLLNIQERVRLVGGTVDIVSAPGEGTSIRVEAPE